MQAGAGLLGIVSLAVMAYLMYTILKQIQATEFMWFYFTFAYTTIIIVSLIGAVLSNKAFDERVEKYLKKKGVRNW